MAKLRFVIAKDELRGIVVSEKRTIGAPFEQRLDDLLAEFQFAIVNPASRVPVSAPLTLIRNKVPLVRLAQNLRGRAERELVEALTPREQPLPPAA
ncbi:MAG: hypothetical protein CEN89_593 [Candidatus Berkelbacteria bacterium Licking1014_7]|uniref:Uncharacterized protein n=1 Tax=Candidatus Berkelbacteria bacterium Licking1014_7 TaxID=2017147 RepID=A0A554LIA1_9BACT|nr:MAG: hypothetical protein CEN89_593 [Candidatus Berkelbacteria bacterium Licking1014_7]